jgi:hypothetical protein
MNQSSEAVQRCRDNPSVAWMERVYTLIVCVGFEVCHSSFLDELLSSEPRHRLAFDFVDI